MKAFKSDYKALVAAFEDELVPMAMKLSVRFQMLMAACTLVTAMSVILYRIREGLPVEK